MRYEDWRLDPPGLSEYLVPADHPRYEVVTAGHHLVWTVEAESWEEAMMLYYRRMGWEPDAMLSGSADAN